MSGPAPVDGCARNQLRLCEYVRQISSAVKSRLEGPVVGSVSRRDPLVASASRCRVRCVTFDYPSHFPGHDKHAPPVFGGTCLSGPVHKVG
jgi:hypothetical protein